jgi:ABC-2 type transport system permease protein
MIKKIALKEFKENLREGRFTVSVVIVSLLMLMGVWLSYSYLTSVQQQHAEAKENARNIWVSQEEKNPHSAAHYGTYAFKPKYPLSLIDPGVDKYAGISIFLEAHKRNEAQYMAASDQTGLARFGDLTPDFIMLFIIPLLIILIGYNAFTREKEQGTLKLLKGQGISSWKLAMGKWLGIFIPVLIFTVGLFVIAAVLLSGVRDFGELNYGVLILLFLVYLVYYAVFINITLIVSAVSRQSGISLVSLLAIWIVVCLAMPKASSNLADSIYPYPSRQAFAAEVDKDKKAGLDGHNPWSQAAKEFERETLEQYGVDSVSQLPFNFDGYRMQKGEEHEAEVYFKHYAKLKETHQKQTRVYQASALASPFLPARFLSMALARTDYSSHWDFSDAAENYRLELQKALNTNFAENSTYGDWAYKADKTFWGDIPDFDYNPPSYGQVLERNWSNFMILGIWFLVSFVGLKSLSQRI